MNTPQIPLQYPIIPSCLGTPSPFSPSPVPVPQMLPNMMQQMQVIPKMKRSVVFFDWDDTLFPTSVAVASGAEQTHLSPTDIRNMGKAAYSVMVKYIDTFGAQNVYIVTNAMEQW